MTIEWLDRYLITTEPSSIKTSKDIYAVKIIGAPGKSCISCTAGFAVEFIQCNTGDLVVPGPCDKCGAVDEVEEMVQGVLL